MGTIFHDNPLSHESVGQMLVDLDHQIAEIPECPNVRYAVWDAMLQVRKVQAALIACGFLPPETELIEERTKGEAR